MTRGTWSSSRWTAKYCSADQSSIESRAHTSVELLPAEAVKEDLGIGVRVESLEVGFDLPE